MSGERQKPQQSPPKTGPKEYSRQSKITPELQADICRLVAKGDHPHVAAGACGVLPATYTTWMRRGKTEGERFERGDGEETVYSRFYVAILLATAEAESTMRSVVSRGDDRGVSFGRARGTLEILKRRFPQRWADRIVREVEESNRLVIDVLQRICEEEAQPRIFARFCEELSCLDSEGEVEEPRTTAGGNIH